MITASTSTLLRNILNRKLKSENLGKVKKITSKPIMPGLVERRVEIDVMTPRGLRYPFDGLIVINEKSGKDAIVEEAAEIVMKEVKKFQRGKR